MDLDPIELQKHLKGVSYPASAEDLAGAAESNGASEEIVEALRSMGGGELSGPDEVMKRLG
jgi:uncharacterized protein DUF2795